MSGRGWSQPALAMAAPVRATRAPTRSDDAPPGTSRGAPPAPLREPVTPGPRQAAAAPRILLVAPQPFFTLRGTPMNVLQMARTLGEAGYRVHLATFAPGEPVELPGVRHHRALPVPGLDHVPIGFSGRKVAHDAALALLVTRLLLTHRFALAHAVEESVFFTLPIARARGVPVIFDLDSSISDQLAYSGKVRHPRLLGAIRAVEAAALRRSALALTVCTSLSDTVRKLSPHTTIAQIEDCPQEGASRAPDEARVAALRERWNPEGRPLAVYTGNFERYQGLRLLFHALGYARARCPDLRLLVVGGTAEEIARTQTYLATYGLADLVVFAGRRPPEEMADYLALADVLVSPRSEGTNTPLKLYDYMAAGRPIVATDLPTHRQVLDQSTAVLARPYPEDFGEALGRVLADPAAYAPLGAAARRRVQRDYSREAFERKLLEAYRRVLGDEGLPPARSATSSSM